MGPWLWDPAADAERSRGARLLTASADRTARLWCLRSGILLAVLDAHAEAVTACAALPRCGRLLTAGDDRTVRIWVREPEADAELEGWRVTHALRGHADAVRALLPLDDERCASMGARDALRIWHVPTGELQASHRAYVAATLPPRAAPPGVADIDGDAPPPMMLGTGAHVGASFGAAPCYVDDAVRCLVVLPAVEGESGCVAVAGTDAGGVHFLRLCAPPPLVR